MRMILNHLLLLYRLNTYFKFLIVRDPFERLISAFKDKFVINPRFEPWYKHDIAPAIIRKYRKSHRDTGHATSGLRFEDFVRYLGDVDGRRRMDRQFGEHIIHWVTYVELCAPCEISYDVVGHHETLEQDAPHILRAAGVDRLVTYPSIPPGITRYNRSKVENYFSPISKRDIRRLYSRYQGDFQLFGYARPDFILNLNNWHKHDRGFFNPWQTLLWIEVQEICESCVCTAALSQKKLMSYFVETLRNSVMQSTV